MDEEIKKQTGSEQSGEKEPADAGPVLSDDTEERKQKFLRGPAKAITYAVIAGAVLLVCFLIVWVSGHWKYSGYQIVSSRRQEDTLAATYCNSDGNILRYGTDGASLSDQAGNVLWEVNYSMTNPAVALNGAVLAIYDKNGSDITVCNADGLLGTVSSHYPVVKAKVSPSGNVAAIEEDADNTYIEYYAADGSRIAEIRTSMDNPGYPLDLAVSENGEVLAVSYLSTSDGIQKALVRMYSFGAAGQNQMDYRIGDFEYTGRLIPEIETLSDTSFVAFTDNGFHVFNGNGTPSEEASVTTEAEIDSVFCDSTHIGLITDEEDGNHLKIYTAEGRQTLDRTFDFSWLNLDFTGKEVSLYNGSRIYVIGINGATRFDGAYNGSLQQIFALGRNRYAAVRESAIELIRLR